MANVGKNIKKLRTNSKMTQDALAEQLFVSRQTVSNYENGKSNPDIDMLVKIAEIFGTDVNALIYGPPAPVNREREFRKFWITAAILTAAIIAVIAFVESGMAEWFTKRYISWPGVLFYMTIKPLICLGLGWTVMQAAGLFFGAKRPKFLQGKNVRIIRRVLVGILVMYLFLVLLPLLEEGVDHWCFWLAERRGQDYSIGLVSSIFPWEKSEIWGRIWMKLLFFNRSYGLIYFLPGVFFWASAPEPLPVEKQEEAQQSVQQEEAVKK